jgi:hypothetical protein
MRKNPIKSVHNKTSVNNARKDFGMEKFLHLSLARRSINGDPIRFNTAAVII